MIATVRSFLLHNGVTTSAALAFYFLMSLFPFLIFLASALALLPIPHLATRMVRLVSHFVPDQTMPMVDSMLNSTMHTNNGLLSAGFILAVIAASNAIASMATALNAIYEVNETRTFWQKRLSAIYVTFVVGGMTTVALSAMLLGPHFGRELARVFNVSRTFVTIWPFMRWALVLSCALASIGTLYYLLPNRKHTLRQQFCGSVFAVADMDRQFGTARHLPAQIFVFQRNVWHAGIVYCADDVVAVRRNGDIAGGRAERGVGAVHHD